MNYIKIEILSNEYQQEELIALFDEYHATGFEQTDEKLIAYFAKEQFAKEAIEKIVAGYPHEYMEIGERNWNEEWEQNFQPVIVEDFVAVRAHFHRPISSVEHVIVITPKMSFGTGHHATTFMMIQQMRSLNFEDKIVFDFGTGTGILAILAEKLGAKKITAIDVDSWSIHNAEENIERNNCCKIDVYLSSEIPNETYDIILANINRNIILEYMPQLVQTLHQGASILFSGLLVSDENDIRTVAVANGLIFSKMEVNNGWVSLLFVTPL